MTNPSTFSTEQEAFWSGDFGDAYTDRNDGDAIARSNLLFWGGVLKRTGPIKSCFEILWMMHPLIACHAKAGQKV